MSEQPIEAAFVAIIWSSLLGWSRFYLILYTKLSHVQINCFGLFKEIKKPANELHWFVFMSQLAVKGITALEFNFYLFLVGKLGIMKGPAFSAIKIEESIKTFK